LLRHHQYALSDIPKLATIYVLFEPWIRKKGKGGGEEGGPATGGLVLHLEKLTPVPLSRLFNWNEWRGDSRGGKEGEKSSKP